MTTNLERNIFRTYDIRGKAGENLTPDVAVMIGRAFATMAEERGIRKMALGRDNRFSSPDLAAAIKEGILDAGVDVIDLGVVITPMLYYALHVLDAGGGVMVTGSHNPADENGFKLALGKSTIYGEEIGRLYQIAQTGCKSRGKGTYTRNDIVSPYLSMLKERLGLVGRNLKVAVDCGNGTASFFASSFLQGLGAHVLPVYCESDPSFPHHHPDPVVPANLVDLKKTVLDKGADVGVAYDGDADRLGVVDERGRIIFGDMLMILFWREILQRYPGAQAIVEVKCSQALVDEIIRLGGRPFFHKTGHSLIKATMQATGAVFTGEMSGHMFFKDRYYGFDDAFYATGRLLEIIRDGDRPLSALFGDVNVYYSTGETRIPCPDSEKFSVVNRLIDKFKQDYEVIDVDGARVNFPGGWALVRASNTQPMLVARCEAKDTGRLNEIKELMHRELVRCGTGRFAWEEGS